MHIFVATYLKEENVSIDITAKYHILAKEQRNRMINKIVFRWIHLISIRIIVTSETIES